MSDFARTYDEMVRFINEIFGISDADLKSKHKPMMTAMAASMAQAQSDMVDALKYSLGPDTRVSEEKIIEWNVFSIDDPCPSAEEMRNASLGHNLMATMQQAQEDAGTVVADYEVWVTPYSRFLHIPTRDVNQLNAKVSMDDIGNPKLKYTHTDGEHNWNSSHFHMYEMSPHGQKIIRALEQNGVQVRLKEVSKPRFGETFWMQTNGIEEE